MIRDARVLKEDFVPKEIVHRDTEANQLSKALEPVTRDQDPENAFLFGSTGVGKTCVSRFMLERLQEEVLDIRYQYVNCWQDYNRFRVLYRILESINKTLDIHRRSTPKDELVERLRDYDGAPYIVVLDEVDQLRDTKVLYDLYSHPKITMILIANREEELFAGMDDRVVSRLKSSRMIRFDKYRVDELVSILSDRVKWGLKEGAVGKEQLEHIADSAAGDARVAIGILRAAAREAESQGIERITDDLIEESIPEAKDEIERKNVEKLNDHQRVLYDIIESEGEISPGDLYERYEKKVEDPVTKRTLRNYLDKMSHYKLIESQGENRGRIYSIRREI
ncbi:MAG: Cdc6/Cdc18 family protein [Halobacteria archaeon]|nr:Cdc6/Cdc18 family protein [Halobacteria archaeon]